MTGVRAALINHLAILVKQYAEDLPIPYVSYKEAEGSIGFQS